VHEDHADRRDDEEVVVQDGLRWLRALRGALTSRWVALLIVCGGAPVSAQSISRVSLDSQIVVDLFRGENVNDRPQVIVDISAAIRVSDTWQVYVRPWLRLPRPATPTARAVPWDKQLYQAGVRYERTGPISTRLDAGYIVSPVGLGLLDSRPALNPTIAQHVAYFIPMPPFDPTVPAQRPVASTYPLGALFMMSTDRWDARGAIVNSAPTRPYVIGAATRPRQTPVVEVGGGLTPTAGLRFGAAVAHGRYATPREVRIPAPGGRTMTMVGGEGEYAFRYTKINSEIVRTSFETLARPAIAYEWFVQGIQTLTPRWFVAARHERASAPPPITGVSVGSRASLSTVETTAGYRVNPDITLRSSYYARKSYNARRWDNQVGFSIVWARRWW
jgi:hypothetical protein